ncbi:hypothetical protein [Helicobacter sp. 23-1045]
MERVLFAESKFAESDGAESKFAESSAIWGGGISYKCFAFLLP